MSRPHVKKFPQNFKRKIFIKIALEKPLFFLTQTISGCNEMQILSN